MKNVKVILIGVALCATVFANARIEALGGDAGFWPGDRANADIFPGTLNDANWIEFGGVQNANSSESELEYETLDLDENGDPVTIPWNNTGAVHGSINWGDDVKWGFSFNSNVGLHTVDYDGETLGANVWDENSNFDWMNMSWAKDGMGLSVGFLSHDSTPMGELGYEVSGFDLGWGSTMSFGELGVGYSSMTVDDMDAMTELTVNWRGDCNVWLFDNAKASFSMTDDGDMSGMNLGYDLFTHLKPADGVTALVGMGFAYSSWDVEDGGDGTSMMLPAAILAVEASMTDWATVRGFVSQDHQLSCDNSGADCGTYNFTDYGFGVGFGWQQANGSSVNLDMEVSNSLFTDPISTMTGFDGDNHLTNGEVTISYLF